ncbi:IclR family transcriptional regulator [Gordonia zhaorongruii]|uniref:IclR family transcriptional regulator n=1 Tax=Gordonia zhaorongruii TaxID=2597659 RepID=UPI00104291FD|nr:IclR family transcriptional regulator [Gordonia zhaorongruii]
MGTDKQRRIVDPKNHIASVVKAIEVLECFKRGGPERSLTQVVDQTGYTRTTVYRLLGTLELAGWVERTDRGSYRLTLQVFELATTVLAGFDLRTVASHVMSELATAFDEHVYLLVPDGTRAVCIDLIESSQPIRVMVLTVGRSLPMYLGGAPVALLAEMEKMLLPRLLKEGPMTTPAGNEIPETELRQTLAETRDRGYAISSGDVTQGVVALGACIKDRRGQPVAAMSIGGLSTDISHERLDTIASALMDGADAVSRKLGYVGD